MTKKDTPGEGKGPVDDRPIHGAQRSVEAAIAAGVLTDPAADAVRAIRELQGLSLTCPHCQGALTQAMLDAGAFPDAGFDPAEL